MTEQEPISSINFRILNLQYAKICWLHRVLGAQICTNSPLTRLKFEMMFFRADVASLYPKPDVAITMVVMLELASLTLGTTITTLLTSTTAPACSTSSRRRKTLPEASTVTMRSSNQEIIMTTTTTSFPKPVAPPFTSDWKQHFKCQAEAEKYQISFMSSSQLHISFEYFLQSRIEPLTLGLYG